MALKHQKAGHGPPYRLSYGLGGVQSQVCRASQLPEHRGIRARLVYAGEEFGLKDLKDCHEVRADEAEVRRRAV